MALKRRTLLGAFAAAPLSALLASCNRNRHGVRITLALSTLNNPFFVDLRDGASAEAAKLGFDLLVVDAQNSPEAQLNQLQTAAVNGSKGVIVNPVDSDAARAAVVPLIKAKIPIIAVDRGVNGRAITSLIASDNIAGGRQAADLLNQLSHGQGKVLVLEGQPGASATRDRGAGFVQELKKFPGLRVVGSQTANFDRSQALDVTSNLLQAHPDATAIYAHNDEMALGAIKALGAKAGKDVLVIGFDGSEDGLGAVQQGTMSASIAQQPRELGRQAVQQMQATLSGKKIPATIPIPVKTVTKANVQDFLASTGK